MRNWVREHRLLALSILILLCLILLVSISYIWHGKSGIIGRSVKDASYAVEGPLGTATETVDSFFSGLFRFRSLQKENEALRIENGELRKQLVDESLKKQDLNELRELSEVLNYKFLEEGQTLVTANVSASGLADWVNLFTIDRGSDDGIYENAVVVSGDGLVGTVCEVGQKWSRVLTILDDEEKISFRVFRQPEYLGIMEGQGDGSLSGYMIDSAAGVIEGDVLITSNMGIYPEGIEIGRVSKVVNDRDAQLIRLEIEPAADINQLRKVTLIL